MTAFDRIGFFQICMDIEKYLGYLRANELATEYLETVNSSTVPDDMAELYETYAVNLNDWKTPCPDAKWAVRAHGSYGGPSGAYVQLPYDATQAEKDRIDREVKANLTTAYENGIGWADGLAMYLNEVCAQFSHVDVDAMAGAVLDLCTQVTEELANGARQEWTGIGKMLEKWRGEGATAFFNFHNSYASALDLFAVMSAQIGAGFAGGTAIVAATQQTAMTLVESIREALETMLAFWVECGLTTPPDPGSYDVDLGKIASVAKAVWSLLRLIPPVKTATESVNTAIEAVGHVRTIVEQFAGTGEPEVFIEPYAFKNWSANELYTEITDLLHNEVYLKYVEAMDTLHTSDTQADPSDADNVPFSASRVEEQMLELQGARDEWELDPVPPGSLNENGAPYGY